MGKVLVVFIFCTFLTFLFLFLPESTPKQNKPPHYTSTVHQPFLAPTDSLRTNLADYIWPTDAGRIVSSVFAEYRSTHFHGGIDISTGTKTGYKVFASRDGYIARIVVGPNGYGKMLWVRHADGYYSTYAHLRNFKEDIDAFVKGEQLRLERYPVSIECAPSDFPVKKGDAIAFTGETGSGSPHLHFEIRDENKDFVNPLLCPQFTFADDSIPRIRRIAITPLSSNSVIEGSYFSHTIDVARPIRRAIVLPETLHVFGAFGFSVDARDRINNSRFHNGVYSHKLFLDDSLVYAVQLDRAPSSGDYQIGLYYDYKLTSEKGGRFEKLYMDSPNRLPFYHPRNRDAGILNTEGFPTGVHRFKIISSDFAQNTTEVSGILVFSRPYEFSVVTSGNSLSMLPAPVNSDIHFKVFTRSLRKKKPIWGEHLAAPGESTFDLSRLLCRIDIIKVVAYDNFGTPSLPRFVYPKTIATSSLEIEHEAGQEFVRFFVSTKAPMSSVVLREGSTSSTLPITPVDYGKYTGTFRPKETFDGSRYLVVERGDLSHSRAMSYELNIQPIVPTKLSEISFDHGNLVLIVDSGSFFRTTFLEIRKTFGHKSRYSLFPRYTILDRGIIVKMKSENRTGKEAIYFRGRGSRWSLSHTERSGEYLVTQIKRMLGDIAIITDSNPPSISRLRIPTRYRKQPHVVSFRISDNLSGVEYKELKLYIDGKFVVPEIDGEHRRVVNRLAQPLPGGAHSLTIQLKDRMGNAREVRRSFRVH